MLEKIHGIPQRIASLKAKLAAREGDNAYRENVVELRKEIARLEAMTQTPAKPDGSAGGDPQGAATE